MPSPLLFFTRPAAAFRHLSGACGIALASCQSAPPPAPPTPLPVVPTAPKISERPTPPPPEAQEKKPLAAKTFSREGVSFTLLEFDDRDHRLLVRDQKNGPGSRWQSSREAAAESGGIAALNAGFFTPEGAPLGLVQDSGQRRGGLNRSSLGSGFYLADGNGHPARLLTREGFQRLSGPSGDFLQAGPRLVWDGKAVGGLSSENPRTRSFLLWDGRHHWALGHADGVSLAGLARLLAAQGFEFALNLDGGRSSDLWVSGSVPGGGLTRRGLLNKPVRNFLVLLPAAR